MKPALQLLSCVFLMLFITAHANGQCTIPKNIDTVSISASSMNLKWDAVSSAQFYQTSLVTPPTTASSTTSLYNYLSLNGLEHNKTYCISVRAVCGVNDTSAWETRCVTTPCTGAKIPSIEVDTLTPVSARALWSPFSAAGAYEYAITDTGASPVTGVTTQNTVVKFQGLDPDKEYCLHVRAFCSATNTYTDWTKTCFKTAPKPTTGISTFKTEGDAFVYPNPAKEMLTIAADLGSTHIVVISDIAGKVLLNTTAGAAKQLVNISALSTGMYIISVKGDDVNLVQRFVKQ